MLPAEVAHAIRSLAAKGVIRDDTESVQDLMRGPGSARTIEVWRLVQDGVRTKPKVSQSQSKRGRKRPLRMKLTENETEAYALHVRGKSHARIGEQLGICKSAAGKRVRSALEVRKRQPKSVKAMRPIPEDRRGQESVSRDRR